MPYYTVIYGAEGKRKVIPKRRLPRLARKYCSLNAAAT
jgi:hypothetical protein